LAFTAATSSGEMLARFIIFVFKRSHTYALLVVATSNRSLPRFLLRGVSTPLSLNSRCCCAHRSNSALVSSAVWASLSARLLSACFAAAASFWARVCLGGILLFLFFLNRRLYKCDYFKK
jgi:hypothetical protein